MHIQQQQASLRPSVISEFSPSPREGKENPGAGGPLSDRAPFSDRSPAVHTAPSSARGPALLFSTLPISLEKYSATRATDVSVRLQTIGASGQPLNFRVIIEGSGWIGNIVQRLRCAMKNPPDDVVREHIVPPAWAILRGCRQARSYAASSSFAHAGAGAGAASAGRSPVPPITLEQAIEGALRFLLGEVYVPMKELVKTALIYYPGDLRLYKLVRVCLRVCLCVSLCVCVCLCVFACVFASVFDLVLCVCQLVQPYLHDSSLDWKDLRLRECLSILEEVKHPDAEIVAYKCVLCLCLLLVRCLLLCFPLSFSRCVSVCDRLCWCCAEAVCAALCGC